MSTQAQSPDDRPSAAVYGLRLLKAVGETP